jgi:hypothetical protein
MREQKMLDGRLEQKRRSGRNEFCSGLFVDINGQTFSFVG